MDSVMKGIKTTIYKSPDCRMGHNIGQSGRKKGVKKGAKVFDKQARMRDVYGKGAGRVCRRGGA
jgi:hypothetical protein